MTCRMSFCRFLGAIGLVGALSAIGTAQYLETPPKLIAPVYEANNSAIYMRPAGQLTVSNVRMTTLTGRVPYPPEGDPPFFHEHDFSLTFDATFGATTVPGTALGHMNASTIGGIGTYLTQIGDFDVTGSTPFGPFMIRRNSAAFAEGISQVVDLGFAFRVTGWLALGTELSTDGGATWTPSTGNLTLVAVPEPATMAVLGLGVVALLRKRRR